MSSKIEQKPLQSEDLIWGQLKRAAINTYTIERSNLVIDRSFVNIKSLVLNSNVVIYSKPDYSRMIQFRKIGNHIRVIVMGETPRSSPPERTYLFMLRSSIDLETFELHLTNYLKDKDDWLISREFIVFYLLDRKLYRRDLTTASLTNLICPNLSRTSLNPPRSRGMYLFWRLLSREY